MVARKTKIACSLDARLLAQVERLRASTGESRSAVIGRALQALTEHQQQQARVARYVDAYREQPESEAEVAAARATARRHLATLPWRTA